MTEIKKILLGIDGSDGSYKAAGYAAELAARTGATVTLMFVVSDQYTDRFIAKPTYTPNEEIMVGTRFNRAKAIMEEKHVTYDTVVEMGNPAQKLIATGDEGYDMIVLGTRGLSAVREFMLGSVSSRVVQHSKIPVLVVP
ncbi:MAG: universal stress protein [Methanomassiliicoccus sp.]|jgi:nucleotide-binding universal stress UspA family protein|nr:universal stress protein [Methanomassiliicoccus sp.]